jgi:hypothetical protein
MGQRLERSITADRLSRGDYHRLRPPCPRAIGCDRKLCERSAEAGEMEFSMESWHYVDKEIDVMGCWKASFLV